MADCGIVGILLREHKPVYEKLVYSLHALQHRGEDACGMLIYNEGECQLQRREGLVSDRFHIDESDLFPGDRGIGHTRYPTVSIDPKTARKNIQPLKISYPWIEFYIAHNGTMTSLCGVPLSLEKLRAGSLHKSDNEDIPEKPHEDCSIATSEARELLQRVEKEMEGGTDTEMIGRVMAYIARDMPLEDAIRKIVPCIVGSFSMLLQIGGKIIGFRDPHGIRPLCWAELPDGYVIASESCVMNDLRKLAYEPKPDAEPTASDAGSYPKITPNEVKPGEGIVLTDEGKESILLARSPRTAYCIFEDAYFSRPDSNVRNKILSTFRQRCGETLGRRLMSELTLAEAANTIIVPIPDGGIPFAVGLANATGIPLMSHALIRDKYIGRTFIRGANVRGEERKSLVKRKISFLHDVVKGKMVILADDSIVRGNTTIEVSHMATDAGASGVIWCFNFPPISHVCPLGIEMFTEGRGQFIVDRVAGPHDVHSLELGIAAILGAKAVYYMTLEEYRENLGLSEDEICTGCITGRYPFEELNLLYGSQAGDDDNDNGFSGT